MRHFSKDYLHPEEDAFPCEVCGKQITILVSDGKQELFGNVAPAIIWKQEAFSSNFFHVMADGLLFVTQHLQQVSNICILQAVEIRIHTQGT